uniref:RNA-binding protein n=1 Tax=Alexandrium catenella TaxID=2925 RepID=A0A7S1WEH6_ALECA
MDATNVHVSDLPAEVDDAMLAQIFGHYGTVTWCKVMPNFGGKPTNAAIVEYATMEEATFVVENVNGNIPHGLNTPLIVSFKRSGKGGGKGGGGGYGKADGNGYGGESYSPYPRQPPSYASDGQELCKNFKNWGECQWGASCKYSHGDHVDMCIPVTIPTPTPQTYMPPMPQKPMPTPQAMPIPQQQQPPQPTGGSRGGRVGTIFLGGLPQGVCEQELNMFFSGHCMGFERLKFVGAVEGRAGMGWAKFASPEHAEAALTTITSGVSLPSCPQFTLRAEMGRNDLDVTPGGPGMHPQHAARNPQCAAQQYSGQQPEQQQAPMAVTDGSGGCDTMFMGSLPATVTDEELSGALMTVPGFVRSKLVGQGEPRPVAFVLFDSGENCLAAVSALHGAALPSAPEQAITCEPAKNSLDKRQRFG